MDKSKNLNVWESDLDDCLDASSEGALYDLWIDLMYD